MNWPEAAVSIANTIAIAAGCWAVAYGVPRVLQALIHN